MQYPAELYVNSSRPYTGLGDLEYPFHDRTITVTCCGRICIGRRKINLSTVFAGQNVGIKEVSDKKFGAPGGIRTPDPRSRNPLLYPLSYGRDVRSPLLLPGFRRYQ
jgi:hypothetical protein